jgi:predicted cupin superfamily sugar epimerase
VHTLHRGRGRYIVIHADRAGCGNGEGKVKASIESFVVGHRVEMGERLQWFVEGGDYKASYLLPEDDSLGVKE